MREYVLYLDFDGVLHPDEVYLKNGRPTLVVEQANLHLFCWVSLLDEALLDYPSIKIRLSTNWVRVKSYNYARNCLPERLRNRVNGATFHKRKDLLEFDHLTRFQQIKADASRNAITHWIAIDDDDFGWHSDFADRLIKCEGDLGLSDKNILVKLHDRLAWMFNT